MGSEDNPVYGDCSDPNESGKMIRYYIGLTGVKRLDLLIHEMLHACFWDMSEETISESGTDIAKSLWKIGYRIDEGCNKVKYPKYVTLRGKRYKIYKGAGVRKGAFGEVSAPWSDDKYIKVRISLKSEKELIAYIRCMIFACFWDFDDHVVRESSRDIGRALWRIGYRNELVYVNKNSK